VAAVLSTLPPILTFEPDPIPVEELQTSKERFTVTEENGMYIVEAEWLKKIMSTINPDDYESLQYFQRVLHQSGIIQALVDAGCQDGDTVCIYDMEFDYLS
jgi:GTP-binding protein